MKNIRRLMCLAACVLGSNTAQAIVTNWTVQSFSGSLSLTGSLSSGGAPTGLFVEPQGSGAFVTSYSGTITTEQSVVDGIPIALRFISAAVAANNGGNWDPLPDGSPGQGPANYGMEIGDFVNLANAAIRDLELTYSSGVIPLLDAFPGLQTYEGSVTAELTSGILQFRPIIVDFGEDQLLSGTDTFLSSGSLAYSPTVTTLALSTTFNFSVLTAGGDTTTTSDDTEFFFTLAGYLTATAPTASVPEAGSLALLGLAGSVVGFAGYRRRRLSHVARN